MGSGKTGVRCSVGGGGRHEDEEQRRSDEDSRGFFFSHADSGSDSYSDEIPHYTTRHYPTLPT